MASLKQLSKFMSLMLRHQPEAFDLVLDEAGFADAEAVWGQIAARYPGRYRYEEMIQVATQGTGDGKQRFDLYEGRIRARYGHNRRVQPVSYAPVVPPDVLYHGTTPDALQAIRENGLQAMGRQYVHLSIDAAWAATVGQRRAAMPVVLTVQASAAHRAGVVFHHPGPRHYLAKAIPPTFVEFP